MNILAFKPNDKGDGHIHGILHDKVAQFGTEVHLGMANNIVNGIFQNFVTKTDFLVC
jgi:hypothetical protein